MVKTRGAYRGNLHGKEVLTAYSLHDTMDGLNHTMWMPSDNAVARRMKKELARLEAIPYLYFTYCSVCGTELHYMPKHSTSHSNHNFAGQPK